MELKEIVRDAAVEADGKKRLACAKAFEIAQEQGVSLQQIGACCNEEKIKIMSCQLGCFQ